METVILESLHSLLSIQHFLYLIAGIFVGLIVGVLPGMGGAAGMAMLLPFVYGMEQTSALALMIGMLATTAAGDSFASILMGIPGGSSSATILDGFPLSRQGQAARALGAAFTSSMMGGVFGVAVLTASIYIARPLILGVGMGERLLLVILALTMVGSLTGPTPLKGMASCGLGLLIGTIGTAPATGQVRFTFGSIYLSDGVPLIVLALGIFAMPEIVDLMRQQAPISATSRLGSGWREGVRDSFRNWWLVLRVSCIGAIIGILPGVGGSMADWMAYGHVVQSSKDRSKFGKGDIRGVIAPEATNNSTRAGDLIPTLFFGIPGSGSMALLLGGFVLIGLDPGPRMVSDNLDLTFVIVWSLAIANILGALMCIALAGPIAKLTLVPYGLLAPFIIVLMIFTAYQATQTWGDLAALMVLALVGIYMKRFEWPRPALIVGFVLSQGLETSLYQTAQVYGFSFLYRPQSLAIGAMVILSIIAGIRIMLRNRRERQTEGVVFPARKLPQIVFTIVPLILIIGLIGSIYNAMYLSKIYPLSVGVIALVLVVGVLIQQILSPVSDPILADAEQVAGQEGTRFSEFRYMAWFLVLLAMIYVVGLTVASLLFVFIFTTIECGRPLWRNALLAVSTMAVLSILSYTLYMEYPTGLLQEYVEVPWWLQ